MGCFCVKQKKELLEDTVYSWDKRAGINRDNYIFKDLHNSEVLRVCGDVNGQQLLIQNCKDTEIYIFDYIDSITIDDCSNCTLIFGAVKGSVYLRNCIDTVCIAYCGQLRTRDCQKCKLLIHSDTQPIIEASTGMCFGDNFLYYDDLSKHLNAIKHNTTSEAWLEVHDFTPIQTECNWRFTRDVGNKFALKTKTKKCEESLKAMGVAWYGKPAIAVTLESTV